MQIHNCLEVSKMHKKERCLIGHFEICKNHFVENAFFKEHCLFYIILHV